MPELSKDTLFHYFAGHSTPLEKKIIEEWLQEKNNIELYYEWLEEWERKHPQLVPSTEDAYNRLLNRMRSDGLPSGHSGAERRDSRAWLKIAIAASLFVALTFLVYLKQDFFKYESYRTGYGEVFTIALTDGSQVTLNANTVLKIPRFGFGKNSRDVFLNGEAAFVVQHTTDQKKFIVHTPDHLEVEVVGTEFVVFSRERGSKVVLTKGEVLLRAPNENMAPLTVKPGDVVTVQDGMFDVKEHQPVQMHTAWKDHKFVFDQTSLREVALQLKEQFDITMTFTDSTLAGRQITGTVQAENAEEFLDVMARLLDAKIERTGNEVVVKNR